MQSRREGCAFASTAVNIVSDPGDSLHEFIVKLLAEAHERTLIAQIVNNLDRVATSKVGEIAAAKCDHRIC